MKKKITLVWPKPKNFDLKKVFAAGNCDYKWVTHCITDQKELNKVPELLKDPVDEMAIIKYLWWLIHSVYIDAYNRETVVRAVKDILLENHT